MTSCSREQVEALLTGDFASRALAHAELTSGQYQTLFRTGRWQARVLRLMGQRIAATGTYAYAKDMARARLIRVYISKRFHVLKNDRRALIEALLAES